MRGSSHSRKALEAARASEGYFNVDLSANFSPQGNKMSSSSGTPPPSRSAEEDGGALSNSKRQSTSLSSTANGSVSPPAVARSTNSHHSHRLRAPQLHLLPNQEDLVEVPGVVERNPSPSPYVVVESTPSNVASGSSTATTAAHQSHLLKSTKPALVASAMNFPTNASSAESGKRASSSSGGGGGTNHYPSSSLLLHHSGNSSNGDLYDFQSPISFSPTSHAMTSNSSRKPAATSPKPALRTMPTTVPQQTVPARHNGSSSSISSSSGLYPHQGIFVVGGANRNYKAPVLLEEQEARPRPSRPRLLPMPATATNYPGPGIPTSTSIQSPAMKASSVTSPRLRAATPPATPGSLARAREVDFAQRTGGGGGSSSLPTTPPADPFSLDDFPSDPNEPRQSAAAATAGSSATAARASSSSLHDWDLIHEDDSNSNRLVAQKEGSGPYHIGKEAQGGEENEEEDRWASSSSLEMHGHQSLEQLEKLHQPVHYQQQQQQHGSDPHMSSYVPQSSSRIPDVFLAPSAAPPPHPQPQPPLLYRDQSGFLNSGNTCYAASVLTMLLRQPRVQKGLAAFVKEYGSLRTTVLKEIITTEYREEVVTVGGGGLHDTSLYGGTQEVPASLPQDQAARLAAEETQRGDGSSLSDYWSRPYGHLPSSGSVPPAAAVAAAAAPAPQKTYVRRVPVQRTDMETLKVPIAALHLALYRCCQKMRRIAKAQQDENRAHFEQQQQRHHHSTLLYPEAVVEEEQAASVPSNLWLTSLQSEERQGARGATEDKDEADDNPLGSDGADTSSSSSNYSTDRDNDDEEEEAARRFSDDVFDDDDNKGTRKKWRRRPKVEGIDMKHVAEALGDESLFFDAQQHDAHEFFVAILARLESEAIDAMQKAKYLTHRKAQVLHEQRMKRQLQEPLGGGGGDSEVVPPPPTPNLKKRDIVIDPNDVWINKLFRGSVLNIISCRQSQCGHQIVAHDPFVNLTTAALSKSQLQLKTQHEEALQKRRQEQLQLRRQQQQQQLQQQSTLHRFAGPWNSHPYHQYSSPAAAAVSTTAATNLPPVPVVKIEPGSLRTLIRESFQSDALDSYKCDQCKGSTSNFQAGCLETAPPLLVVQVKRFEGFYDKVRSLFLQKKLSIRITMDDDLWIVAREAAQACGDGGGTVRQFQYRLRSVLFHSGSSLEAGHYICSFSVPVRTSTNAGTTTTSNENTRPTNDVFTRMTTTTATTTTAAAINHRPVKEPRPDKSVWYLADDEVVRQLPPAEGQGPLHATGYMMLYELISMRVREDRCVVPPPTPAQGGGGVGGGGAEGSRKRERSPTNSPPPSKQDRLETGGGSPRKQTDEEVERDVANSSNGEYFVDDPNAPSSEHWSWRVQFPPLV